MFYDWSSFCQLPLCNRTSISIFYKSNNKTTRSFRMTLEWTLPPQHDVLGTQPWSQGFGRRTQLLDWMLINLIVCWLTPPSLYLNQYWLVTSYNLKEIFQWYSVNNYIHPFDNCIRNWDTPTRIVWWENFFFFYMFTKTLISVTLIPSIDVHHFELFWLVNYFYNVLFFFYLDKGFIPNHGYHIRNPFETSSSLIHTLFNCQLAKFRKRQYDGAYIDTGINLQ